MTNDSNISHRLPGIPDGLLARSRDVIRELKISHDTWRLWREAGLPVINTLGTDAEMVLTSELIAWMQSNPTIGPRKSKARNRK